MRGEYHLVHGIRREHIVGYKAHPNLPHETAPQTSQTVQETKGEDGNTDTEFQIHLRRHCEDTPGTPQDKATLTPLDHYDNRGDDAHGIYDMDQRRSSMHPSSNDRLCHRHLTQTREFKGQQTPSSQGYPTHRRPETSPPPPPL